MEMYQKDYLEKRDARYEELNYSAWLQGSYIVHAVQNALYGRKAKYPDKPYGKDGNPENDEDMDVYEVFRRRMRAMNERMKENNEISEEDI